MNLYQILNVDPYSNESEIRKSYFKLAKKYHPDKNKNSKLDNQKKFHSINYAYNILINNETRTKYNEMNNLNKHSFHQFLEKIFEENLKTEELKNFGIKITDSEYNYLEDKIINLFNKFNLSDVFNLFKNNIIPKKETNENICSDTDVSIWEEVCAEYFNSNELPIKYQKYNINNIFLNLNIKLNDLIKPEIRKITIKRQINNKLVKNSFEFYTNKTYVIFNEGGDIDDNNYGNLIIKFILPKNYTWDSNLIYYNYNISLYKYIFGDKFSFTINNEKIEILNWVPYRDGYIINLNLNMGEYKCQLKFNIDFTHINKNKEILLKYFN